MAKTGFDLKNCKQKCSPSFSSVFDFKQAKEQTLCKVHPLKMINKKQNCLAHFRVTFTKFSGALLQVKRRD